MLLGNLGREHNLRGKSTTVDFREWKSENGSQFFFNLDQHPQLLIQISG